MCRNSKQTYDTSRNKTNFEASFCKMDLNKRKEWNDKVDGIVDFSPMPQAATNVRDSMMLADACGMTRGTHQGNNSPFH